MKGPLPSLDAFDLVAIGCSAGGIEALTQILPTIPATIRATIVVVIHLPANAKSILAEIFEPRCALPVKEAEDKEPLAPGHIYFAPAGYHLLVETDRTFSLSVEEPVNYSRPAIDVLFETAARAAGRRALGILLTGASHDGAAGLKLIQDAGGTSFVQDPATAEHPVMPKSALDLFRPDAVLSLRAIAGYFAGDRHGKD